MAGSAALDPPYHLIGARRSTPELPIEPVSRVSRSLPGLAYMHVEMASARFGTMGVFLIFEFNGNGDEASVTYATLGDDMLGEIADIVHRAPQHRDLHAAIVIEVDVQRSDRQIMVVMENPGQALRQLTLPVIIDVDERRHTLL